MSSNSPVFYDPVTDRLSVLVRKCTPVRTEIYDDREFVVEFDEDGRPIRYDIRSASQHPDVVNEALAALHAASNMLGWYRPVPLPPELLTRLGLVAEPRTKCEKQPGADWIVDVLVVEENEVYPVSVFGADDAAAAEREALWTFGDAPQGGFIVLKVERLSS